MYFCARFERFTIKVKAYMRKCAFSVVLLIIVSTISFSSLGCSDKKPADISANPTDTATIDSMDSETQDEIISETPMPKAADKLFDDFFFNFVANRNLQVSRIKFPLPVNSSKGQKMLAREDWRMDRFFMEQDYYTLIFDSERQMDVVKDTTVTHVTVEKIYLTRRYIKLYTFERMKGAWMLTRIDYKGFAENRNASFLDFYRKFIADSTFQAASINDPLQFTGPSPDDDFTSMDGILAPEQWPSFAPELPAEMIYNINYGTDYRESNRKVFVIRGIANGLETELTFQRKAGRWKLTKLIM